MKGLNVTETTARKIVISGIERLDTVALYLEDTGPGAGKATITCFNDSWSYYWGSIGTTSLAKFLLQADNNYLAHKFSSGLTERIPDMNALAAEGRKKVVAMRKQRELDDYEARTLFNECDEIANRDQVDQCPPELMQEVFGDEWWMVDAPSKPNPDYEYLCRILNAVKAALKELEPKA